MRTIYNSTDGDTISVPKPVATVLEAVSGFKLTCLTNDKSRYRADLFYRQLLADPTHPSASAWARYILCAIEQERITRDTTCKRAYSFQLLGHEFTIPTAGPWWRRYGTAHAVWRNRKS